jgi:hypothetical protein
MRTSIGRIYVGATLALTAAAMLNGCASTPAVTPPMLSVGADQLVGKWGLASYHNDADRARTEAAARAQCNKPYVVAKGPSGGVMMYLADQSEAQELIIKNSADGRTFLGPAAEPAGGPSDREIITANSAEFVTQWVDPDAAGRYGTMVYARCPAR